MKGKIMNDILKIIKENKKYQEDFITRSTYHSNGIEGSTLTYSNTYAILYNDNSFKLSGVEPREIYEAINHKKALEYVLLNIENNIEFSNEFIKNIGIIINKDIKNIDGYRKVEVMIRGAEDIPPEPSKIQNLMYYFVDNYNNQKFDNIFLKIAKAHIDFEHIHPFEDGNGRTGRLLINYELIKNNIPPVIIEKDDRSNYFELLRNKNVNSLAAYFEELSNREEDRINKFQNIAEESEEDEQ